MVVVNEWLPNPTGADTADEWIELRNSGGSAIDLSGWKLATKSGSRTTLQGTISSGQYLVLTRSDTKLALKNTDEGLSLYDASGKLAGTSSFLGSAPEGKSFSRSDAGNFVWAAPTPGAKNDITIDTTVTTGDYPIDAPFNHSPMTKDMILLAFGVGITFVAVVMVVIKRSDDLQKLFFGRN